LQRLAPRDGRKVSPLQLELNDARLKAGGA
jgi:hypothetical protein